MSRNSKGKQGGEVSPEEATATGNQTTAVEQEGAEPDREDGLTPLSKEDQQAAIAGSMGGGDNYPYQDRTAVPLHERNLSAVNNPLTEASQAELNPAFTAKAEDGGPVNENDESIGTEPNVVDRNRSVIEESGDEDALKAYDEQIAAGKEQQMDAQAVTDAAPTPKDAEGNEITPAGAPSGMEPSSDGEAGTAGAKE